MTQPTERKTVLVYEDEIKWIIKNLEDAETERSGLSTLIYEFTQENNLSSKFYNFLDRKNKEDDIYYCDIDFLMLDYI